MIRKYAIIVAAGSGIRMGSSIPKQFLPLRGKPLLWYSVRAFLDVFEDIEVILVLPEGYMQDGRQIAESFPGPERIYLTVGGKSRFHSVKNGLAFIKQPGVVFVHDGVRCLVSGDLIYRCYAAALDLGNAVPALSLSDSIRIETTEGSALMDREKVKIIQTPQSFRSELLLRAFDQDYQQSFTDESSVVEKLGIKIHLIEGESSNIKITIPTDLMIAEKLLESREQANKTRI